MDFPLDELDRMVKQAQGAMRHAHRRLMREGLACENLPNPLERDHHTSRKDSWLELMELKHNPVAAALADWVYTLTLDRVLFRDMRRVALSLHEPVIELSEPSEEKISFYSLRQRWLSERDPKRARLWAAGLVQGASRISEAEHIFAERRAEAIRLLGAADPLAIEIPCEPSSAAFRLSEALLTRTAEFCERRSESTWDGFIRRSLARDADADFPARITARWLESLFERAGFASGLRLELDTLPASLGAASIVRALAQFGRALARAALPSGAPFSLALPPFDLRPARRAWLFGALPGDKVFLKRALGLGSDRAREQARKIARAMLISLRLWAARVLLRDTLRKEPKARADAWQERSAWALGEAIPGALAGVLPRLSAYDACEFLGMLMSASDRRNFIERFDEDWFHNPKAAHALREEQSLLPPSGRIPEADLQAALSELVRAFEQALG